ncbi:MULTISPECIES: hypothetical protein [unclassified Streptomyces]|uniref:hypothetical protein n=1 Tax=unclassified Streptomyces TaxID=2593676 RepID=UPI003817CD66
MKARLGGSRGRARAVISVAAVLVSMLSGSVSAVADGNGNGSGNGPGASDHWGLITRNTIGSAVAQLRNGPFVPVTTQGGSTSTSRPPYGTGSLGIQVTPDEKVDFGNEVDFLGDRLLGLDKIGFHVFQTSENVSYGGALNMPNIRIEIDPNMTVPDDYSTLVWNPPASLAVNSWSKYIDATESGTWYLTGGETSCTQNRSPRQCTFAELKASFAGAVRQPTILSIAVGKGRDHMWIGAVDGLRINRYVYDFEPTGVRAHRVG